MNRFLRSNSAINALNNTQQSLIRAFSASYVRHFRSNSYDAPPPVNWGIRIVPEKKAYVIGRFGKYAKTLEPGINLLIPFVDKASHVHSVEEESVSVGDQSVISKDNVSILVDGVLYVKMVEPKPASYQMENPRYPVIELAKTTMHSDLGKSTLDKTFEERDTLNDKIVIAINEAAKDWGLQCRRYKTRDISPPHVVKEAKEMQPEAELKKCAQNLESEGERQPHINIVDGKKSSMMLEAQGEAEAILARAQATNRGAALVSQALKENGEVEVPNLHKSLASVKQSHPHMTSISPCSILTLLKDCKNVRNLEQVHTQIIRKGFEQDHFLITQFISACNSVSSNNLSYAQTVFDRVLHPGIYLWNTLVKSHCTHSSLATVFGFFRQMKRSHYVAPDKYTFPLLVKSCSCALALKEGRVIHGLIIKYGTESDVFVGSSLIDFYGKCREIVNARKVFDELPVRNEVTWTSMIVGYSSSGDCLVAKKLFDEMPERNQASWNAMINAFIKSGDLLSAKRLFDEMPCKNKASFTTMINGFAKSGDMASARSLFDQSPEKDIISWSAMISGYAQNGQPKEAIRIFIDMRSKNVKPDEYVMVSLMSACSQAGDWELAKWVDSYTSEISIDRTQNHMAAALVDMNAKCGNLERAATLFSKMPERDMISYCSMIQGLSVHGRGGEAVDLFHRMLRDGVTPDDVAFTVVLSACSHADLVEEGCRIFDMMVSEYSITPSADHYACKVDLLGRAGRVREAYEVLKEMPVEPHAGAWGALLWACRVHGEVSLGKEVAGRLFKIEPRNAANYVLLSDMYAASDQWSDVNDVRKEMTEKGIRKLRGCSWI
ncbi:hypothetical protein OSB04_026242 [Centaurea solstitialis]|uniref:Band 7 domain-containing protein n=1 Tax=Centaurea solstitialis TaxID=347529 RepID=A0AA38W941_9ASTR|nr:hypothetical protein OSB04_026242 [Centaurea solstitialis]